MVEEVRAGPLDAIRVLDFTNMLSGPYCTRLLSDLGAEVLKIEPPGGDHNRGRRPLRDGHSSFFGHLNSGKKSVVLNLKSATDRDAAIALAATCDVVVENWRPGVAERLGVDYLSLREANSRLIYASISGFGQSGPDADRPAYAPILHAATGYDLAQAQYQGTNEPQRSGTFVADILGGLSAFAAIQTALYHRSVTGAGRYVDVSLMDCMLNLMVNECQEGQAPSSREQRIYQPIRSSDGFVMIAPTSQRNFERLCDLVGHQEWLADPRFSTTLEREAHWTQLMQLVQAWTESRTGEDCEASFNAAGVPCARYQTVMEAMFGPQTVHRRALSQVTDPSGSYWVPNPPFKMEGLDIRVASHVPALGEHTAEVFGQIEASGVRGDTVR
ncbi:MAG: CoA transferase [Sphingomonadales bacterium]|nr:MAG: CoA transferase [Sphingomonadales bacterium]